MTEWADFQTMWEQRLLEVAEPYLDPAPTMVEGSRMAQWEDGSCLEVMVEPTAEEPVRSGFWNCRVSITYGYEPTDEPEHVSRMWGQIQEAFGDGENGGSELRLRLTSGRLVCITGIDAVRDYGGFSEDTEAGLKQFQFTTNLGIKAETAT